MGSKKAQTIGYKYFASGHFVLCHGPIDAITQIRFQDKDAYTNEESENKRITINKPNLFGGDEQAGGVQGSIDLLFGYPDQQKSSVLKRVCGDLISAWRGVMSVVFDNLYIGTSPTLPDSKWRVKRVHTLQDGQPQWYDEKAEINLNYYSGSIDSYYKYHVQDGFTALSQLAPYAATDFNDALWLSGRGPFGSSGGSTTNTSISPKIGRAIMIRQEFNVENAEYVGNLNITIKHDDGGVLYWNGEQINLISDSYFISHATIPNDKIKSGKNILFCAAVDSVPSGSPSNIYLDLEYSSDSTGAIEADINPAHIIRECLTNTLWGKGAITGLIDDVSFKACADTLYAEGMGMSIVWSDSTSIKEFIDNVLEHINGELYVDRITNLWTLQLIRDDYDIKDLVHLTESHYKSLTFERKTLAECINQVTVTYYDRERAKDSTITIQDVARIAQQGGVISQNVEYKGFTNSSLASRVALRDLKTLSSELASVEFDVPESIAENWHKAYVFKLSNARYGLSEAVFRVTEIKFGDGVDNTVSIKAIEDSFSSPMQAVVEYMPPVKSDISAKDATAIAFEVPYIELVEQYGQDEIDTKLEKNPDLSFVGLSAVRPNNFHINASVFSNAGAGYAEESTLDFCPSATLKTAIGYLDTIFEVENVAEFDLLKVNDRIQLDDELLAFISFDATTHILTVKRGVVDTVPAKHNATARIYGWDNYSGLDSTEYLSGETVAIKALTLTGSDILDLSEATAHSVNCSARAIRPYPPANVKIGGVYYPADVAASIVLTWVDRNRVQQTGGSILGYFDAGVTVESGVTYKLTVYAIDAANVQTEFFNQNVGAVNTYTVDLSTAPATAVKFRIVLKSIRSTYESYQSFDYTLNASFTAPYNLTGVYIP
ncbi:phage tail protein [Acinetobacter sp. ANC 5383]